VINILIITDRQNTWMW